MFDLFICYAFHRVVSASQFTAVVFHIKFIGTGPLLHPIKISHYKVNFITNRKEHDKIMDYFYDQYKQKIDILDSEL